MPLRWLRRRRILRGPFPREWAGVVERLGFHSLLDEDERAEVRRIVQVMVAERDWEGCRGLAVTDEMRVTIAAHAARLILHIDHDYYPNVLTILLYPTGFLVPHELARPNDAPGAGYPAVGQAWPQGPVVLAWDAVQDAERAAESGCNVVLHEFAHKLDLLDGHLDGMPLLRGRGAYKRWARVVGAEYERHVARQRRGEDWILDPYAASDRCEFFAVATECFFERPVPLRNDAPALYDVLRRYYQQDPAARGASRPPSP